MSSKNRRIFSVLAILQLFNSLVYSREIKIKDNALKKDELMNQKDSVAFQKDKLNNQSNVSKKNSNISPYSMLFKAGLVTLPTVLALIEMGYILNQRGHIEDMKKQLDEANETIKNKDDEIKDKNKIIKNSGKCPTIGDKYKFHRQLGHGEFGSTALFNDSNNNLVVIKTLFRSGKNINLDGIEKEKEAVKLSKSKPKNKHMVFPIDYFEDNNFLILAYPYVLKEERWFDGGYFVFENSAPTWLNFKFNELLDDYGDSINDWNDITKQKCLWHLTKQWFEIYKYFHENKFCHMDICPNTLLQLNGTMCENRKINYDDFTIKLIDWGIWEEINWGPHPVANEQFKKIYIEKLKYLLLSLYKNFDLDIKPHRKDNGDNCDSTDCCAQAFFSELDELIGVSKDNYICSSIYKTVGHENAKTFDELIDFCQQQINKLS